MPAITSFLKSDIRKALKMGGRIDDDTPAARLHELRIQCKKLRYLLDFYSSLYDREAVARIIRALKKLQDNLGDFNDLEVQQKDLQAFAEDLARLAPFAEEGLVEVTGSRLQVTREGKQALRLIAACFDAYLGEGARYSQAV